MSYAAQNPYITVAELLGELRQPVSLLSDTAKADELARSIERASRWVDDYTQRDFFLHDHTVTPLKFDQFNGRIYDAEIFLPFGPVIQITEFLFGSDVWTEDTHYVIGRFEKEGRIYSLVGNLNPTVENRIQIKGLFGYAQPSTTQFTEAGDAFGQVSAWALTGVNGRTLYWRLQQIGAGLARVRLATDSAFTNLVAQGTGADTGTGVVVTLAALNSSGINGTVEIGFTTDDADAANTLTPIATAVDSTQVPTGLPSKISTATRLVAAAFSGLMRREEVGLDGSKTTVTDKEIPKTVYQLLGKRMPLLV